MLKWYQCEIKFKNGTVLYWRRFFAKNKHDAERRNGDIVSKSTTGSLKSVEYGLIATLAIDDLIISEVPDSVINLYDMNRQDDVELFYRRGRDSHSYAN